MKKATTLRKRLQILFAAMAVLPTVTIMIFSVLFYHFIIDEWFSERVDTALNESQAVAQAYIREHKNIIRADALAMARDLNRQSSELALNPKELVAQLQGQALLRSLARALLLDGVGNTIAYAGFTDLIDEDIPDIKTITSRDVVLFSKDETVSALIPLDRYVDTYLFITRRVDPLALRAAERTNEATLAFKKAEQRRRSLQWGLAAVLLGIGLLLVSGALYVANRLSKSITRPINSLVAVSRQVREGNLEVEAKLYHRKDELRILTVAFNRMTRQLFRQHRDLLKANLEAQERRYFIETVFKGVSAGIISLDSQANVQLFNEAAQLVLPDEPLDKNLLEFLPAAASVLEEASKQGFAQKQLNHENRTLLVRITRDQHEQRLNYVLTFDDVTDLLRAQKTAAWVQVAQRLAHEIKNPLTPLQLSTERLQRKFYPTENTALFEQLIDTILRQVDDMQRLLNEFSSFARMPQSEQQPLDLVQVCQEAVATYPQSTFKTDLTTLPFTGDAGLLRQALGNLIKNAIEAEADKIILHLQHNEKFIKISIQDNGIGFNDQQEIEEFMEPYVTTKEKGTGLGLAIVKKIVEEHKGVLKMQPLLPQGSDVSVIFGSIK